MIENKTKQRKPVESHFIDTKEAINIIAAAVKEATGTIASAAREAVQLIASDAREATKLLASNAADAVKVTNIKGSDDHDLLIELRTNMNGLRDDIKTLKNGNVPAKDFDELKDDFYKKNEKQDIKIEALENKTANYTITMVLYSIAVAFMIGLTLYHMISKG